MRYRVAYYANHHGSGHIRHAEDLATTVDCELLVISEKQFDVTHYPHSTYVQLSNDIVDGYTQPLSSPFHYTPTSSKITARFMQIAQALAEFKPDIVIVDLSAEVTAFTKLLGYPVITRIMHGDRNDLAHQNAYRISDQLLAYYPEGLAQPDTPTWVMDKTIYTGMLSPHVTKDAVTPGTICLQTSTGGVGITHQDLVYACEQTPNWQWTVIGLIDGSESRDATSLPTNCTYLGFVDNPDTYLSKAEIIISSSGHNAVARSAAYDKPLILFYEERPYYEQQRFAETIAARSDVSYIDSWQQTNWSQLLSDVTRQNVSHTTNTLLVSNKAYGNSILSAIERAICSTH